MNTTDEIKVNDLLKYLRESIETILINQTAKFATNNFTTASVIKASIQNVLYHNNSLTDSVVNVEMLTWKRLYPKLVPRMLAFTTYKLYKYFKLIPIESLSQHWYHTILPYKISYEYEEIDIVATLNKCEVNSVRTLRMKTPYTKLFQDTTLN